MSNTAMDASSRETTTSPELAPRQLARIAGGLYLINIIAGAFAIGYVDLRLVTADLAVTTENISANPLLYRSGLAAHVLVTVTNVPLALIFYELFKVVHRRMALLVAFFILVATAIEAAGIVGQFAPLILLGNEAYADALSPGQLQAQVSLAGALASASYNVSTVFFGLDILGLAYLVLRSGFAPKIIGVLLAIDGLAYLIYSFTDLLAPALAAQLVPWIQFPAPIAEGAFSLWLLVFGMNTWPRTPGSRPSAPSLEGHLDGP